MFQSFVSGRSRCKVGIQIFGNSVNKRDRTTSPVGEPALPSGRKDNGASDGGTEWKIRAIKSSRANGISALHRHMMGMSGDG